MKQNIISVGKNDSKNFITWSDAASLQEAIKDSIGCMSFSKSSELYRNVTDRTSLKDSYDNDDYNEFRPEDIIPKNNKQKMLVCEKFYNSIGVVKNTIDLMSEFASQGIDIVHPSPSIQKFYKKWFKEVNGKERSERFLNCFYKLGVTFIERITKKIDISKIKNSRKKLQKKEQVDLPIAYSFINPYVVNISDDFVSKILTGTKPLFIKLDDETIRIIKNPKNEYEREILGKIPEYVKNKVRQQTKKTNEILLDGDTFKSYFYKKDDWEDWSDPLIYPIITDLQILKKMKLADKSALDGIISCIRVWKLGSLEHKILPTPEVMSALAGIIGDGPGSGGVLDLIWNPAIELLETSTESYKFLGEDKYIPILNAIHSGLGVSQGLVGNTADKNVNNYISLKILTERLQYGREVLISFWESELELIRKAMGFRSPAKLSFDMMVLSNEASEKQLLVNLVDRKIISVETLRERVGEDQQLEKIRINREEKDRESGKMPEIVSPFKQSETIIENTDPIKGGRPPNSKDKKKRKQKTVLPLKTELSIGANILWAEKAMGKISDLTSKPYLKKLGKKTFRELTNEESEIYEKLKVAVLASLEPYQQVDIAFLAQKMSSGDLFIPDEMQSIYESLVNEHMVLNKEITIDDSRKYRAMSYSYFKMGVFDNCS